MLQIAQILKSNGTDGEVIMGFRNIGPEDLDTTEPVFIYFDGLPVPFFIDSIIVKGVNKASVHLTDIDSFEDAEEIVGKKVWASIDEEDDEEDMSMLVGWTLFRSEEDGSETEIGRITEYLDIPNNPCIEVDTGNDKVIVPLHEDLITAVDPENEEIVMNIPAGLI